MRQGSATRKLHLACALMTTATLVGFSAYVSAGSPGLDQWLGPADGLGDARVSRLPPVAEAQSHAGTPLSPESQPVGPVLFEPPYGPEASQVSEIPWASASQTHTSTVDGAPWGGPAISPAVAAAADAAPGTAADNGGLDTTGAVPDAVAAEDAGAALPEAEYVVEDAQVPEEPTENEEPLRLWSGSFELGLDGTEGNSQTFNVRFGFEAKRETEASILSLDLDYNKKTSDGEETANKLLLDWRLERLFHDAPWTCHVHGTAEYDEYQAYDMRWSVDLGLGYRLLHTERTTLASRAGAGFSQEVGLPADEPDDENAVEAVFGLELSHELNERQQLSASADYTPDVSDFMDCRISTKAAWEVLLDESMNLKLKLQARNRYDSTPRGKKHNDLDYAAMLMWSF